MSVLVDKNTRLLVQGITGKSGAFHARGCRDYGTNVVAGVTPGRGGEVFDEKTPVFDTVAEARTQTGCNATMIFVPAPGAADSILEAADAGVELIVCITEGIPVMDMMRVKTALTAYPAVRLIGPNCPGIITPDQCKIGIMPGYIHRPGTVGVISRSGTLDLRGGLAIDLARVWPVDLYRHRRRSDQWDEPPRSGEVVYRRSGHRGDHFNRRDRRHGGRGGRAVAGCTLPQAGGGVYRGRDGSPGTPDGPRGRDRQRGPRHRRRQDRRARSRRHRRGEISRDDGGHADCADEGITPQDVLAARRANAKITWVSLMTTDSLRERIHAVPFRPFTIRLAGGRSVPVPHPNFILVTPAGGTAIIASNADDHFTIVDVLLVTPLEVGDTTSSPK